MKVRQRNQETKQEKQMLADQRAEEERQRAERNAANRDNQRAAVRFNRDNQ